MCKIDYSKHLKRPPHQLNTPIDEKKITLKDGRTVNLISLTPGDTDRLLAMLSLMSDEALRWSMAPYKREWVEKWLKTTALIQLAAEHADEIVGFVCIDKYTHPKRRGTSYLGAYFHRDFAGSGLENAMMKRILDSARQKEVHKVDAGAVADDEDTISLLEGFGFETEGRKRDDFFGEDGRYHDVLAMGRILDEEPRRT
jgi:RimJ/RimL family protein N-acetyltransferase